MIPLILRFANKIPASAPEVVRYDSQRQIAEVLDRGEWVDRLIVCGLEASTMVTMVNAESTDDQ